MLASRAVKHQPGRFNSRGAQHQNFSVNLERLFGHLIDAGNALCLACFGIDNDVARDCVSAKRKPASPGRGGKCRAGTAEIRIGRAAAIAVSAVVTRRAAVVLLGQDRGAADSDLSIFPPALDGYPGIAVTAEGSSGSAALRASA